MKCLFWVTISNCSVFPRQPSELLAHFPPQILKTRAKGLRHASRISLNKAGRALPQARADAAMTTGTSGPAVLPPWLQYKTSTRCERKTTPHCEQALTSSTSPYKGAQGSLGTRDPTSRTADLECGLYESVSSALKFKKMLPQCSLNAKTVTKTSGKAGPRRGNSDQDPQEGRAEERKQ